MLELEFYNERFKIRLKSQTIFLRPNGLIWGKFWTQFWQVRDQLPHKFAKKILLISILKQIMGILEMLLTIVFGLFEWPYAWPDISHWQAPIIQVNQVFKQSREASSILTYFSTSFEKQHQMRINWPQASQRGNDQSETLHTWPPMKWVMKFTTDSFAKIGMQWKLKQYSKKNKWSGLTWLRMIYFVLAAKHLASTYFWMIRVFGSNLHYSNWLKFH